MLRWILIIMTILYTNISGTKANNENSPITAFVNVNVVPMDSEHIIEEQTVIIDGKRISKIGPANRIEIPEGAFQIDGKDKYLMPGLADMHVHVWDKDDLLLYVANGITVIRNMNGRPYHLEWRKQIAKGDLLGPVIYTSGPTIYNEYLEPEQARQLVIGQKEAGYDFIKMYHFLRSKEAYQAILTQAKKINIPVVGHKPRGVPLLEMLGKGQISLEHMMHYVFLLEKEDSPLQKVLQRGQYSFRYTYGAVEIDEFKIPELARKVRDAGVWNCPTLVALDRWVPNEEAKSIVLLQPHIKYLRPSLLRSWNRDPSHVVDYTPQIGQLGRRVRRTLVREFHKVGAKLILGTDAGANYIEPGFSIHTELQNLVDAGLSPYQAIRAGTVAAAEFLNAAHQFGRVAEGMRADLILLEDNPLLNVGNLKKRTGVLIQGKWYSETKLQQMIEELAKSYE